jgi:dihydrofolate synthase/folylpolyglutamate synthase
MSLASLPPITHIDLTLERIFLLKKALKVHPTVPVVSVAGTNGKGSTTFILSHCLQATGYRVGTYTSPHLHHFSERITVNGVPISEDTLNRLTQHIQVISDSLGLKVTHFEILTLAAWLYFTDQNCTHWILEVGLGGRLDAVNALDADIALFTSISLDHTEWLGHTLSDIAYEKAGIARAHKPALVGQGAWPVLDALVHKEALVRCETVDFQASPIHMGPFLPSHIALAEEAYRLLTGHKISPKTLEHISTTQVWPGRFEQFFYQGEWILDVAHNVESVNRLANQLSLLPLKNNVGVWHSLSDKDLHGMVRCMKPLFKHWILAAPDTSRASPQEALEEALKLEGILCYDSPRDPFSSALEYAKTGSRVVVFGGFHVVAEYRQQLINLLGE